MNEWGKYKDEHLELAAAIADKYDDLYENSNFAASNYMRYEIATLENNIRKAPSFSLAIDLGCGTGRDSFILARHFNQVYGYDFSQDMVRVANRNKLEKRAENVLFEVLDVEDNPLPLNDRSIPFVNTGFGMGSFLQSPEKLFREVRRILQPSGIAIFSFYNSEALVNALELEWKPALAARVIKESDILQVDFEDESYRIAAKAYSLEEIKNKLEGNFRVNKIETYPTLSALFPQSLFKNEKARELCTNIDQILASNTKLAAGQYIVAVCQKGGMHQN